MSTATQTKRGPKPLLQRAATIAARTAHGETNADIASDLGLNVRSMYGFMRQRGYVYSRIHNTWIPRGAAQVSGGGNAWDK